MVPTSKPNRSHTLLAAGLLALLLAAVPAPCLAAHSHPIDIGHARTLPLGTVVTVEGSATVPSGDFSSSSFDEGFAIQDHTGGIYVSVADDLGIRLRDRVRVTGQLQDSFGLLILVPAADSDVQVDGRGRHVEPRWVETGSIGEATEGRIVQVVGTITAPIEPDPPFGTKITLDDGSGPIRIFVNTSTGIDVSGLAEGQHLRVTGFSSQFNDYEIDPRFPSDIRRRH